VYRDVKVRLGSRIRATRVRYGWTQAEFADYLGLDRSYIAEIELGKRNVCLVNLEVIAKGLGMTLAKLFYRI
jgi:transcriptional regulator with XRE-family HTH domain